MELTALDKARKKARVAQKSARSAALSAIRQAFAWPRCGQDFPATPAERAAQAWAIKTHGSLEDALAEMGVFS